MAPPRSRTTATRILPTAFAWTGLLGLPLRSASPQAAPDARAIIAGAIARRRAVLDEIHDARYAAYVKVAAWDLGLPHDSLRPVVLVDQVRSEAYWELPDRFLQTIVAHRSGGRGAGQHLASVMDIADAGRDRVELEIMQSAPRRPGTGGGRSGGRRRADPNRVSMLSPIAADAEQHYEYQLLDTVLVLGRRAYRLAVIPRSPGGPSFTGTVDVADSTWDVLLLDLRADPALKVGTAGSFRYVERFADAGG